MHENDYRHLLARSPFAYAYHKLIVDDRNVPIDYVFLEVNDAFEKLTGLAAPDIINRRVTEVLPGIRNDNIDWVTFYGEVALHGGTKEFEHYSNDLHRWYKGQVYAPTPLYFAVIFVDITTELEKTIELEKFFSVNLDLLCIADVYGNFIKVNKEWETMLGYPIEELQQRKFLDFVHPDDLEETLATMEKLNKQERVLQFTNRYQCRDGSYRTLEWRSQPSGILIYGAARDITERKALEANLTQSHERFKTLVDSSPLGIVLISNDGTVQLMNREFTNILGYTAEDLPSLKEWWVKAYPDPEARQQAQTAWAREINDISPQAARPAAVRERTVTTKTGKKCEVEIRNKRIGDEMMIIFTDVTERKHTAELLIQSEKMHSIGGLAAGIAHEINNPLGGILQGVQNITRRLSQDIPANAAVAESTGCSLDDINKYLRERRIDRMLEGIRECGERAADIVANMLKFSRKSAGNFEIHAVPDMVEHAIGLTDADYDLKSRYDIRQICFVRDFAPELPDIECSKTEIIQVLFNLIRNATQAIFRQENRHEKGKITITLSHTENHITIAVTDNGPGMDEETRRRIFEPFFTTKPPGEGTGLGLPVSFLIITRNHNGTIEVESSPGNGTTFFVKLPIRQSRL